MRALLVALSVLAGSVPSAHAQVGVSVDIGIHLPAFPQLVVVPGHPVYYAPRASVNYFFYDGLYWVYVGDSWYASSWYDGPWQWVGPEDVPVFVLRVPVRYYRHPPAYFRGWRADAPPRWGEHWGRDWEQRRGGWDRWDRSAAPRAAPLPTYQRRYSGDRYPRAPERQHAIRSEQYRYTPREAVTRQHFEQPASPRPAPQHRPPSREVQPSRTIQPAPPAHGTPAEQRPRPAVHEQGGGKEAVPRVQEREPEAKPQGQRGKDKHDGGGHGHP